MTTCEFSSDCSKDSLGARLVRWVAARQQRRADRKILDALATFPHQNRDNYVGELKRRLGAQS
jgi:hypothetical protein